MEQGGIPKQLEHADLGDSSARLTVLFMNDQHVVSEHARRKFAEDVRGSARGPTRRDETLPQIDAALVIEMFNTFQSQLNNMEALIGRQSTVNNLPVAPALV